MTRTTDPGPRTIDIHTHVVPRRLAESAERGESRHGIAFGRDAQGRITTTVGSVTLPIPWPTPWETPEARVRVMDERRVDVQILSLGPLLHWYGLGAGQAEGMAREVNDDLAEMVASHPARFLGLGFLPLQDPRAAVGELERCISDLELVGVMVGSHVDGLDWDAPQLFPILEAARDLKAVVFVHPTHGRANRFLSRYHLRNLIGNPFETTVALASLIFGGVLDRIPDLTMCFAHGGGYACLGVGRFDHGRRVRAENQEIEALPSDYLRRLYFDSIVHSHHALSQLITTVGVDRVVLGSDYPADMGEPFPVDFVEAHPDLTDQQKQLILGGNLQRVLAQALVG